MIGKTVSHYRITRELGAGGMGIVYEAVDTRLDRTVALKFLPPESTRDPDAKARFVHEAKAASAIDHPNVCNIYEIDESDDGQLFLAMACYEGETLKDRIASGPLPLDDALDITRQVAEGLTRAHEQGIVHRDIKPANIFITSDNLVKILDFGLAKLSGQTRITRVGTTMGTTSYLSPEQARGEVADHRSDLWSLGVVLYEMVSGSQPFQGGHPQAIIYAILNMDPDPLTKLIESIPVQLDYVIGKCLAKDPSDRYQETSELLSDLFMTEGTSIQAKSILTNNYRTRLKESGRPSIAVLPLEDLSPHGDQEYFCDGIAEDLINNLTHIKNLDVVARGSAFSFKGQQIDVREIGQSLGAKSLLAGSLRKSGNNLRITVQLIDVADGFQIWSERYDRQLTDVFAIQDEISLAVVDTLKVQLLGAEHQAIHRTGAEQVSTYNVYLKGRYHWNERSEEGLWEAVDYFEDAVAREPGFALAYVGLADTYNMIGAYGFAAPDEVYPQAMAAARKALEIDPDVAEAHAALGWVLYEYYWDWSGAEVEFRRTFEIKPGYSVARMWYAHFLMVQGRLDEAIREFEQTLIVDPFALIAHANIGCCHYYANRLEQAKEVLHATLEISQDLFPARMYLGWTHLAAGEMAEAIAELRHACCNASEYNLATSSLGYAYGVAGNTAEAKSILTRLQVLAKNRHVSAFDFSLVHLGLGNKGKAMQWLEESFSRHEMWISYLKVTPLVDQLRHEPRFQAVIEGAGFAGSVGQES